MRKQYRNPFIKTTAQRNLADAIRDYKIWFHLLEYGDEVGDGFHSIQRMAIAVHPYLSLQSEADALMEGIRIFKESTDYNAWRKSYTKPVNTAMDIILKRFPLLPAKAAIHALHEALETT